MQCENSTGVLVKICVLFHAVQRNKYIQKYIYVEFMVIQFSVSHLFSPQCQLCPIQNVQWPIILDIPPALLPKSNVIWPTTNGLPLGLTLALIWPTTNVWLRSVEAGRNVTYSFQTPIQLSECLLSFSFLEGWTIYSMYRGRGVYGSSSDRIHTIMWFKKYGSPNVDHKIHDTPQEVNIASYTPV